MSEIEILKNLGLTKYEAMVYLTLLRIGKATVGEICKESGTPRPRVYDTLESLEKKGFVIRHLERPMKYSAVSPELALEIYKEKMMEEINEKVKNAKKTLSSFKEPTPESNIQLIRNSLLFYKKLNEVVSKGDSVIIPKKCLEFIKEIPENATVTDTEHAIVVDDHVILPVNKEKFLWITSPEFKDRVLKLIKK